MEGWLKAANAACKLSVFAINPFTLFPKIDKMQSLFLALPLPLLVFVFKNGADLPLNSTSLVGPRLVEVVDDKEVLSTEDGLGAKKAAGRICLLPVF